MKEIEFPIKMFSLLARSPLFGGFTAEETGRLLRGRVVAAAFDRGEVIYDVLRVQKSLGFLVKGRAQVFEQGTQGAVLLNELAPPGVFGAAAVFSSGCTYVTEIRAKSDCTVCFLPEQELEAIMAENFQVAKNYIKFLTGRVNFLNRKIECFTRGTAEERLGLYLSENRGPGEEAWTVETPGFTKLAQVLGVGRASLYRALDALCERGVLEREGKKIRVLKPNGLG